MTVEEMEAWLDARRQQRELDMDIQHVDGTWWYDAPVPPWHHECSVHTSGWYQMFTRVGRCACGATLRDGFWFNKNERRRADGETAPPAPRRRRWWRS